MILFVQVPAAAQVQQDAVVNGAADGAATDNPGKTEKDENASAVADAPDEAENRELGGNEDPMAADKARREDERTEEAEKPAVKTAPERTTGFDLYGSIRVRYREQRGSRNWQDGGSRAGVDLEWRFRPKSYLYARYEAGFNVLTGIENLTNPGENVDEEFKDTVFTRLWYAGIDSPVVNAVAGKNWSTYYKVSGFTDRFMGTGGSASGTYNAQSDGGPTGPGRADDTIQTHFSVDFLPQRIFKPFDLNLQVQHGNDIPFGNGATYGTAVGVSAVMTTQKDFTLGIAYNHAAIDLDKNPSLRRIGLTGDARAATVGARAFGDRWYAGLVISKLADHETTDDGIYFDGWGSEFYGEYRVYDRIWLVGGFNVLEPDADDVLARYYRLKYAVAGIRYTFDEFRRMIWANVRIDDSVNADGTPGANVYTIGIRWDLSKRGWHRSN